MSEMVERSARAMLAYAKTRAGGFGPEVPASVVAALGNAKWEDWQLFARVAIQAMREPTTEMTDAGMKTLWSEVRIGYGDALALDDDLAKTVFALMIDEALKE